MVILHRAEEGRSVRLTSVLSRLRPFVDAISIFFDWRLAPAGVMSLGGDYALNEHAIISAHVDNLLSQFSAFPACIYFSLPVYLSNFFFHSFVVILFFSFFPFCSLFFSFSFLSL